MAADDVVRLDRDLAPCWEDVRTKSLGAAHRQTVENRLALAGCVFDQGRHSEAFELYETTDRAIAAAGRGPSIVSATALGEHGLARLKAGRLPEAIALLQRSVALYRSETDAPGAPDAAFGLARARWAAGQHDADATDLALEAQVRLRRLGPAGRDRLAVVNAWLRTHAKNGAG